MEELEKDSITLVAQHPSLSVEENIIESVVGSRPTSGDLLLHLNPITKEGSPPSMVLTLVE